MSERPLRILAVYRHPTPHRDGLLDRLAALPGLDLEVLYLMRLFAETPWERGELAHRHRFLRAWLRFRPRGWEVGLHPGAIWRWLRFRPDVTLLSGWADPTVLVLIALCRLSGRRLVLGGESFQASGRMGLFGGLARAIARFAVRGARAWLPAGSRALEHFVGLGADRARCHHFPTAPEARRLALEIEDLRRDEPGLREKLGLPPDGVVVFIGRLIADKAPEVLLAAFSRLRARHPEWRLLFVGEGPSRSLLEPDGAAPPGVELLGFRQPAEVLRILAAADLLALPSRYETWGAAACEGAAAGLPVVLSENVGCGPDLVGAADFGAIVPVDDPEALAAAIERLLLHPERRGRLRDEARASAIAWGQDLNLRSLLKALQDAGARLEGEALELASA